MKGAAAVDPPEPAEPVEGCDMASFHHKVDGSNEPFYEGSSLGWGIPHSSPLPASRFILHSSLFSLLPSSFSFLRSLFSLLFCGARKCCQLLTPVPARSDCLDKMVGGKLPVGETCTLVVRRKQAVREHARA
jgi:hypothetical protein